MDFFDYLFAGVVFPTIVATSAVAYVVHRYAFRSKVGSFYVLGRIDQQRFDRLVDMSTTAPAPFDDPLQIFAEQIHEAGFTKRPIHPDLPIWDGTERIAFFADSL